VTPPTSVIAQRDGSAGSSAVFRATQGWLNDVEFGHRHASFDECMGLCPTTGGQNMSLRTWLNDSRGARLIEAEEARERESSVDAKYIVKQLMLWFVVLPPLLALLIYVLDRAASS